VGVYVSTALSLGQVPSQYVSTALSLGQVPSQYDDDYNRAYTSDGGVGLILLFAVLRREVCGVRGDGVTRPQLCCGEFVVFCRTAAVVPALQLTRAQIAVVHVHSRFVTFP